MSVNSSKYFHYDIDNILSLFISLSYIKLTDDSCWKLSLEKKWTSINIFLFISQVIDARISNVIWFVAFFQGYEWSLKKNRENWWWNMTHWKYRWIMCSLISLIKKALSTVIIIEDKIGSISVRYSQPIVKDYLNPKIWYLFLCFASLDMHH